MNGIKERLGESIFLLTIGVLLAWSLIVGILSTTILEVGYAFTLLRTFTVICIGWALFLHRYIVRAVVFAALLFILFLLYGFFTDATQTSMLHQWIAIGTQTVHFALGYVEYDIQYEQIIIWTLQIAIGFLVLVFAYLEKHFIFLFVIFTGAFVGLLFTPAYTHYLSFYVFASCILAFLVGDFHGNLPRKRRRNPALPAIILLVLLAVGVASVLPVPSENFQESISRAVEREHRPEIEGMEEFSISYIGFGDESGRLGGDLRTNNRIFMFIQSQVRPPFYLVGAMYDTYTGDRWLVSNPEERQLFSARDTSMFQTAPVLRQMDVNTVHPGSSIFWRGIVQDVFVNSHIVLEHENGQIQTETPMPAGTWYTIFYYDLPNFSPEEQRGGYVVPGWFYERYTALPGNLPERVRELAQSITAGAQNDYEKARMLEAYLRGNYRYTLSPGDLPQGRDFVDHFLFDIQEGYCVHFATAFVVMARSIGLMSRYVEGFLVSGVPRDDSLLEVRNDMGHAWAEVYFPGFGWHLFEPTSSAVETLEEGTGEEILPPEPSPTLPEETPPVIEEQDEESDGEADEEEGGEEGALAGGNENEGGRAPSPIFIITILLCMFGLTLTLRVVFVLGKKKKEVLLSNREAVERNYRRLEAYMKLLGEPIGPEETRGEFVKRISKATTLLEIFERARYSDHQISLEERGAVEAVMIDLEMDVERKLGKPRYFWHKYVLDSM